MNILDCSHYTSVVNTDGLRGVGPLDWVYGMKLSYSVPDVGCERCSRSGGTCGFDTETEGMTCICSGYTNSTRECGSGSLTGGVEALKVDLRVFVLALGLGACVFMIL